MKTLMLTFFNTALFYEGAYAQRLEDRLSDVMRSGGGEGDGAFEDFVQAFVNFAVPLGIFCAFVLLAYAAFVMITSAGNPEKLSEAREVATNAVIGALMIALGVIILSILEDQLGVTTL